MAGSWWIAAPWRQWGWRPALGGTILLLPLMTLGQAYGHDPGRGPPSDTGPPASQPSDSTGANAPPAAPAEDNWHHNLVRERPVEVRLRTARKELQAGHVTEALRLVQAVLDSEDDVFVRLESQPVPSGAQHLADQLLGSLPPEEHKTYETLEGSEARRLLAAADAKSDLRQLTGVVRRFFHTAAGRDACIRLAHYWLEHGNVELASACWRRLLDDRMHSQRLQPAQLTAAACCFRRAGHRAAAEDVEKRLGVSRVTIAGREVETRRWIQQFAEDRSASRPLESSQVCGASDRNGVSPGTIPALGRTVWSIPLGGKKSEHVTTLAVAWETFQRQSGLPVGAAHIPIVVGDRMIYRDFEGIRAISLATGATLWFYETVSSPGREIVPRQGVPAEGNPDPNDAMRWLVGNAVMGTLSADGRNVFAVDRDESDPPAQTTAPTPTGDVPIAPHRQGNVLLALPIVPPSPEPQKPIAPLWMIGGRPTTDETTAQGVLVGHYFIGPPLPLGDRLYAVSEFHQQLYLSCLDAASGAIVWSQSICSVSQPISTDHHRFALVCSPSYQAGVLVVPTQAGLLVAADPVTGRLLWAASHDDGEPQHRQQMSAWPYSSRRRYSHRGYTNLPLIHQGRVVFLPAHSEYLHCLDLATGRVRWRVLREDLELSSASEYVAAIADGSVLVVGRRRCRGVDIETGAQRYSLRLGSSPVGRGVRLGANYHVPLEDGRVVSLDVATGRPRGRTQPLQTGALGNLVAAGDLVISMGRTEITAWPQAEPELLRLSAEIASRPSAETALPAAELELSLGRTADARARINSLERKSAGKADASRMISLEREIILTGLQESQSDRKALLARLEELATTPEERGRYLLERALFERKSDAKALFVTVREVADRDRGISLSLLEDPSRSVALGSFVSGLQRSCMNERLSEGLNEHDSGGELATAIQAGDTATLQQAIEHNPDDPNIESARLRLARLYLKSTRYQAAELLLLQCRSSANPVTAAGATRLLAELWQDRNLAHDAGRMLDELHGRFAFIPVEDSLTGSEYVAGYPRERSAWQAYRRFSPPHWSGTGVRVTEVREPHENLQAVYGGNGIISLTAPRALPFDLFDKGRSGVNGEFTLFDRHTGEQYPETITIPGRYHYPVHSPAGHVQHSFVGNFLPVGGPGTIHGISLLERKLLWTVSPTGLQPARDNVRIGPARPGYLTCQYRQHLLMLDPTDGRILWRRDDLETMSGLMSDPCGIIGDERVLVVFAGPEMNAKSYTVYDSATGEELRRGRLDLSTKTRRAYGRMLFHGTASDARRLRVWDPLADRFIWDVSADEFVEASLLEGTAPGTKLLSFVRDSDEVALIAKSGHLCVIDLPRGETRFEVPLAPEQIENVSSLRVFRDSERYYFNLQRSPAGARTQQATHIVHDAAIPTVHVQGELLAVDRRSQDVLWSGTLGARSIVQLTDYRLPVLVSLFRVRKGDQTSLGVEIVDVRTGESLASRDDLLSDRLLQVLYERQPGVITLRGGKADIRIEFPDDLASLNVGEPRR